MNIRLFNLLEDNNSTIAEELLTQVSARGRGIGVAREQLKPLIDLFLDGYIDHSVTGDSEAFDHVTTTITSLAAKDSSRFVGLLALPQMLSAVVTRLIVRGDHSNPKAPISIAQLNGTIEHAEKTAHECAISLLDEYQQQSQKDSTAVDGDLVKSLAALKLDPSSFGFPLDRR